MIPFNDFHIMHKELRDEMGRMFQQVFDKNWFIQGEQEETFNKKFAQYCGAKYCIGVGNGLEALRMILQAYDIEIGRAHV